MVVGMCSGFEIEKVCVVIYKCAVLFEEQFVGSKVEFNCTTLFTW